MLMFTALHIPMEVQAAPSAKTVKNAYISYLKKQISNAKYDEDLGYRLYDFNKDGVKELIVSVDGGRACADVYTYRNNKVVSLIKGETEIGYIKGKKYLVCYGSGGALDNEYTVYKISKGKLVTVNEYAHVRGVCKKDGKESTEEEFQAFAKTVVTDLGTIQRVAKDYYSPKQLGISIFDMKPYTCVTKVSNDKIYYYTFSLSDFGDIENKSKLKSAKITNATKFYFGDTQLLFSGKLKGDSWNTQKWIYKVSKKQFVKEMEDYNDIFDRIIIKDGKVQKVIIHVHIAD